MLQKDLPDINQHISEFNERMERKSQIYEAAAILISVERIKQEREAFVKRQQRTSLLQGVGRVMTRLLSKKPSKLSSRSMYPTVIVIGPTLQDEAPVFINHNEED